MASFTASGTESYVRLEKGDREEVGDASETDKAVGEDVIISSNEDSAKASKRPHVKLLVGCLLAIVAIGVVGAVAYIAVEDNKSGKNLNSVVLLTGGKIHGSNGSASSYRSVELFNLGQNGYCNKTLDDLPDQRIDHTINFFKGKVILCGGQGIEGKSCLSLDKNQRFIPHSQLNQYRARHVGAVVNDELLIVGGSSSKKKELRESWESWNGSKWIRHIANLDEMWEFEMNSCMAAVSEDTILMTGGGYRGGRKYTNKMLKYKNGGVWARMEDYPGAARSGIGCAYLKTPAGDSFLIAGGSSKQTFKLRSSYLYNIGKRQWEEVGKMAHGRVGGRILNVGGRIIIVGGSYGPLEVEEYDVYTKTWKTIPQKIKYERGQFDAVVVPGALVGC